MNKRILTKPTFGMIKNESFTNKMGVILVGNINGRIADFADEIVAMHQNTLFLCTGNFMLGRLNPMQQDLELGYLEGMCAKHDNVVLTIRGNLDNPYYFDREKFSKVNKGLSDFLKHVKFLEDYTVVSTRVGDFLCIGGMITPGGNPSEEKHVSPEADWGELPNGLFRWEGEEAVIVDTTPEIDLLSTEIETDINPFNNDIQKYKIARLITSVMPSFVDAPSFKKNLDADSEYNLERQAMSLLWDSLQNKLGKYISFWYYPSEIPIKTTRFEGTTFVGLLSMTEKKEE